MEALLSKIIDNPRNYKQCYHCRAISIKKRKTCHNCKQKRFTSVTADKITGLKDMMKCVGDINIEIS